MTRKARQLYGVSVMSFSFSAPRCHPALHRLCQSANDAWTRLSTCSLSSSGCYHRLSARLLIASSYLLFLITFTLADAHPLPQFPPLSTHFYSLNCPHPFAGATCGEQVNKSLSSSGEDNEATGVVFACCRCLAWGHTEEDDDALDILVVSTSPQPDNTSSLIRYRK